MPGDLHVRFLGGGSAARRCCYPTAWYPQKHRNPAPHFSPKITAIGGVRLNQLNHLRLTGRREYRVGCSRNAPLYLRRAGREITVGISIFGAASAKALNCSGFRNMTEQPEQA